MINHITAHAFSTRVFDWLEYICDDMDAKLKCLNLHTEVRWLSWGKLL